MEEIKANVHESGPAQPPRAEVPPDYEPPEVLTYRGDEILEEMGPSAGLLL